MVDKAGLKTGDFVWMPVEVPGASYGVQEEEGDRHVFEPLGITWEVTEATLDQADDHHPDERLPDRQPHQDQRRSSGSATW